MKAPLPTLLDPSIVHDCHMPEPHLFKRRHAEQHLNGTSQSRSKRQKLSHHSIGSQPPPAFWDSLSKIWLTKRALRELDRRNAQSALNLRPHRSLTRHALAELKKTRPLTANFLSYYAPGCPREIKLFSRHGGADLSDLRGYPEPISPLSIMSLSQSDSRGRKWGSTATKPTTNTTTAKSTGPYDRCFQQKLTDGGVYPDEYEYPDGQIPSQPDNWEEINRRLAQPRLSLSPSQFSDKDFRKFKRADAHSFKEKQVSEFVIPIIVGKITDVKCVIGGTRLSNLNHLTDGTIAPGNPDFYDGARPEQLKRRVRDELSGHIIPSTQEDLPIVPNFFLTVKGPEGSAAVAARQVCYDGALGARGMHSLQTYKQDASVYDNNAFTITSIYHNGQLKMYTSHPSQPSNRGDRPEYYMTQINTWGMTGSAKTFRQGAAAFRNARDWAKEQRDGAILQANEMVYTSHADKTPASNRQMSVISEAPSQASATSVDEVPYVVGPLSQQTVTNNTTVEDSETSADELALDPKRPAKRTSKPSQQPRRKKRQSKISGRT